VGEQGSGKSAIAVSLLNLLSNNKIYTGLVRDSITLHGLLLDKKIQNIPDPLILVDDYSSSGTYYAKVQLWSALTQLSWYKTFSVSKKTYLLLLSLTSLILLYAFNLHGLIQY
jgi:hypothetical protein